MSAWTLKQPPSVTQATGFKCWAAALQSWLAVTPNRPKWPQDFLLKSSAMWRNDMNRNLPDGAIDADIFKAMAVSSLLGLRMSWEEIPAGTGIADDDLYSRMLENGYLFLSYTAAGGIIDTGNGVRHCVVVWAANDEGVVSIMNPSLGAIENQRVDHFRAPLLVAFRSPSSSPFD
jgi:hypothetical protein